MDPFPPFPSASPCSPPCGLTLKACPPNLELRHQQEGKPLHMVVDSEWVSNGIMECRVNRRRHDWHKTACEVAHTDLWEPVFDTPEDNGTCLQCSGSCGTQTPLGMSKMTIHKCCSHRLSSEQTLNRRSKAQAQTALCSRQQFPQAMFIYVPIGIPMGSGGGWEGVNGLKPPSRSQNALQKKPKHWPCS